MPLEVIRRAIQEFPGARFINAFGQTETASTITMLPPEDHVLEGSPEEIETKLRRLTSIGRPLDDVEIQIVDEDGNSLPAGEVGEIVARGGRMMAGYWQEEAATREILRSRLGLHRRPGLPGRGRLHLPVRQEQGLHQAGRGDGLPRRGGERPAVPPIGG